MAEVGERVEPAERMGGPEAGEDGLGGVVAESGRAGEPAPRDDAAGEGDGLLFGIRPRAALPRVEQVGAPPGGVEHDEAEPAALGFTRPRERDGSAAFDGDVREVGERAEQAVNGTPECVAVREVVRAVPPEAAVRPEVREPGAEPGVDSEERHAAGQGEGA